MNVLMTSMIGILGSMDPATLVVAFADSDGGELAILLLLLSGPIYFSIIYGRYRNKDKRHFHEKETPVRMTNLQSYDQFYEHLKGQRSSTIKGANNKLVEGSLVKSSGGLQSVIDNTLKKG